MPLPLPWRLARTAYYETSRSSLSILTVRFIQIDHLPRHPRRSTGLYGHLCPAGWFNLLRVLRPHRRMVVLDERTRLNHRSAQDRHKSREWSRSLDAAGAMIVERSDERAIGRHVREGRMRFTTAAGAPRPRDRLRTDGSSCRPSGSIFADRKGARRSAYRIST